MGLLWTLTASILGVEITLITLFLLPFLSARLWRKVFRFRIFTFITDYMIYLVVGLGVMFVNSVMKLRKSNAELEQVEISDHFPSADFLELKRLNVFLAQRNLYISFFGLFLWLVLTRLVKLISTRGQLEVDFEATKKQALSATEAAQRFMNESLPRDDGKGEEKNPLLKELEDELKKVKKLQESKNSELKSTLADLDAMKSQAEATKREFDRLLNELHPETKD